MSQPIRLFVSATSLGLRSFRIAAAAQFKARGYDSVFQEEFDCDYQEIRHTIRDKLTLCDGVVLLVGSAYGFEPRNWPDELSDRRRSYAQLEYDVAIELDKPVYRFIASPNCRLDAFAEEQTERQRRQREYILRLKDSDFVWYEFESLTQLLALLGSVEFQRRIEPNLPFASIKHLFKGRGDMFTRIRQALLTRPSQAAAVMAKQAIHGLGGVGKTRLAVEYAYRYAGEYSARLYVSANSSTNLQLNLASLCSENVLNLVERNVKDVNEQVTAVLRWFHQHTGWLLILDNVDTPESASALRGILKDLTRGHVLITSRLTSWDVGVSAIELDALSVIASTDFLLDRTAPNPVAPTGKHRRITGTDHADAAELAKDLGGLALALEQAGAYICQHGATVADYRKLLKQTESRVLLWFDAEVMKYPKSVAVTWQASMDQLYDDGRTLLSLLAWLAPDPIPLDMIKAEQLGDEAPNHPIRNQTRAIRDLQDYSLAQGSIDGRSVTIHRLVQDVTRFHTPQAERRGWILDVLNLVNRYSLAAEGDPNDVRSWPIWGPSAPHIAVVVDHGEHAGCADPTRRLMSDLGVFLKTRAQYPQAEQLFRRALAIDEASHGPQSAGVGVRLSNLAVLVAATNRLGEAESLHARALAIDEVYYGPNHPNVALRLNNLAEVLRETNRLGEAELLYRRALAIDERSCGSDHPTVARALGNLAVLLGMMHRWGEAEPLLRRSLAIHEQYYGVHHPRVAWDLNNLAFMLSKTYRANESESLYHRALLINETNYGPDHPDVARDLNNLAELLLEANRASEAEPLLRRAMTIFESSLGNSHPKFATALNNLAGALEKMSRLDEAEPLYRRALAIDEESYGPDHPDVARDLNNLARLLGANRASEAEPLFRRAIRILQTPDKNHPSVAVMLENLAALLLVSERRSEAEPLLWQALAIKEATLPPDHIDLTIPLQLLGAILFAADRESEAEPLLRRVVRLGELSWGQDHPDLAPPLILWAGSLYGTNRMIEAESVYEQLLRVLFRVQTDTRQQHPQWEISLNEYYGLLTSVRGLTEEQAIARIRQVLALEEPLD